MTVADAGAAGRRQAGRCGQLGRSVRWCVIRPSTTPALERAFAHGGAALVESYVELGREVRCGVVVRDGELVCLPLEEYAVDTVIKPDPRRTTTSSARTADGELYLVAKDASTGMDRRRPTTRSPTGWRRRTPLPRRDGVPALQPVRLPHRPRRVSRGSSKPGLYCSYAPTQRHRRDGRGRTGWTSPTCSPSALRRTGNGPRAVLTVDGMIRGQARPRRGAMNVARAVGRTSAMLAEHGVVICPARTLTTAHSPASCAASAN